MRLYHTPSNFSGRTTSVETTAVPDHKEQADGPADSSQGATLQRQTEV